MMNEYQRRILKEAALYGGANVSVPEQLARMINGRDEDEGIEEAFRMGDPRLRDAAEKALPPRHAGNPDTVGRMTRVMWDMWAQSGGKIRLPELARLARVKLGLNEESIEEAPVLTGGEAAPTLFGWQKHQFEAKFRDLMKRMGFEKGIIYIKTENNEMKIYFANAAKARDFVIMFNGLARRKSMGSVASVATQFNRIKSPPGTNAIVSLDLSMVRGEELDPDGTDLYEWLAGSDVQEGAVKAALEDFMYSLPKQLVRDLRPVFKAMPKNTPQRRAKVAEVMRKHSMVTDKAGILMGYKPSDVVNDHFNTFHGESVEVEGEQLSLAEGYERVILSHLQDAGFKKGDAWFENGVLYVSKKNLVARAMTALKKKKDIIELPKIEVGEEVDSAAGEQLSEEQQVIGKYRFTSFTEGSISGWMVSVQGIGEVGFIEAPAKKNTRTSIAPHRVFRTKGQPEGKPKLVLTAWPDSSSRFVSDKEVRFGPRQLLRTVATWLDKHGKAMMEETQFVAEQFKAGDKVKVPHRGKMVSGKIVRFDGGGTGKAQQHGGGYVVDVGEPASILVPKQKVQKEEAVAVGEAWWEGGLLRRSDADKLVSELKSAYEKGGLSGIVRLSNGERGRLVEMITGLKDFLFGQSPSVVAYVLSEVRKFLRPTDRTHPMVKPVFEQIEESD